MEITSQHFQEREEFTLGALMEVEEHKASKISEMLGDLMDQSPSIVCLVFFPPCCDCLCIYPRFKALHCNKL